MNETLYPPAVRRRKPKRSEEELKQIYADRDWWRSIAKAIGAKSVVGFTNRDCADIRGPDGSVFECPGWLALKILEIKDAFP